MIIDNISNLYLYRILSPEVYKALTFLHNSDFNLVKDGKYQIDGDKLFYIVQRYKTKPFADGKLEAHRKYVDIQFLAYGEELIYYHPLYNLVTSEQYSSVKDCEFFKIPATTLSLVNLTSGMFSIIYPQMTHMPCICADQPTDMLKVVVKVLI